MVKSLLLLILTGVLLPSLAHAHAGMGDAGGFMHVLAHLADSLDPARAMLVKSLPYLIVVVVLGLGAQRLPALSKARCKKVLHLK